MNATEVNDDDLIYLNVGGQKITTTRSTLCQIEGSLLALMFSGHWDNSNKLDKDGAVFLDYNPQYFVPILNYLRAKTFSSRENPASLPKFPEDQVKDFQNFVQYLGMNDEIFPTDTLASEKFKLHSPGVTLQEGGKVAVNDTTRQHRYVLGENVNRKGIANCKLKLVSFQDNDWMLVGIVKWDVVPPNNYSYKWRGSFGWALGKDGQVWKDGSRTTDNALKNVTKEGDTIELVLDFHIAKLSLRVPTGQQFHIEIPKSQSWRLNVNLLHANDKICIIN